MNLLEQLSSSGSAPFAAALLSISIAFCLGQLIAGVYVATFRGLSYSRSFVQAIPLGAVITSMLMLAIGDSIAAGIGLAGGLSIVRFRTTMRDPRDMVFVFGGLGVGIACGLRAYPAAIGGTLFFAFAAWLLHAVAYGARKQFDGLLRLVAANGAGESVNEVLRSHTRRFVLVTMREAAQGDAIEQAWQVRIPDPDARAKLVGALLSLDGVSDVSLHLSDPTLEV